MDTEGPARAAAPAGIRGRGGADPADLVDPAVFARETERERARAHRTGCGFLVISLRIAARAPDASQRRRLALLLAGVLSRRGRISDLAGWRTKHAEVGVILPATPPEGAAPFIEAVEGGLRERLRQEPDLGALQPELVCEVFAYPEPVGARSSPARSSVPSRDASGGV
jgi:hypothetical protein